MDNVYAAIVAIVGGAVITICGFTAKRLLTRLEKIDKRIQGIITIQWQTIWRVDDLENIPHRIRTEPEDDN